MSESTEGIAERITNRIMRDVVVPLEARLGEVQDKLDRLMLEYCPEDMTLEQIVEWERHQRIAPEEKEQKIKCGQAVSHVSGNLYNLCTLPYGHAGKCKGVKGR